MFGLVAVVWKGSNQPKNQIAVQPVPQAPTEIKDNKNLVAPDNHVANLPAPSKPKRNFNPRVLQTRNSKANRAENTVANHAEVATDFMPLGYLNPALLQDGGQIVRVEVPRTTMASFGLPVNMDRYNERVKADVLLGVDGVPHAIRFVQDKRSQ
jgi:hypothetical protein